MFQLNSFFLKFFNYDTSLNSLIEIIIIHWYKLFEFIKFELPLGGN